MFSSNAVQNYSLIGQPVVDREYKFVREPDDSLKCPICLEVAEEPHQHGKCGKLFCKRCISAHGIRNPCPICKEANAEYFEDTRGKREIKELQVICRNVTKGCEWEGTLGDLDKHTKTCSFTLIACPNKCSHNIERKDMKEHLKDCPNREHLCEHCGKMGRYFDIAGFHQGSCDQKIIPCTNDGCDKLVKRKDMRKHVTDTCKHTVITCKYESIGCDVKMKRRDVKEHEEKEDKLHLQKALDAANKAKLAADSTTVLEKDQKFVFMVPNHGKRLFHSPSFYTSPSGYHMEVIVYGISDRSISICMLEGKFDQTLKWPFIGTISIEVLNQEEDCDHYRQNYSIKYGENFRPGQNYRCQDFLCAAIMGSLYSRTAETKYFKNNTLYFRVSVSHERSWLKCTPKQKYTLVSSTHFFK